MMMTLNNKDFDNHYDNNDNDDDDDEDANDCDVDDNKGQGFWYFAEKKAKFRRIFRGKFAEKSADFAGFSREKSQNLQNNRPISGDLRGRKVKIRRKIGPFRGILAEKSQFSKDFRGQILRKIGRFHGKFRGETSPRNNQ